ncbi:MAG: inositol monophosphatase family protein [Mycobacteriaceae bacterium]
MRELAVHLGLRAAELVRRRRREVFGSGDGTVGTSLASVRTKSTETDPVTVVDTESEQLLRSELARLRPDDAVLGEEGGGDPADTGGLRWVLDPIDGTVNFLYGLPVYAVSVGVQRDGVSVAGAVVDVAAARVFAAARGAGATLDGVRIRCTGVDEARLALVGTGFAYDPLRRSAQGALLGEVLPRVRDVRRAGSAALDLCSVAAGWLDAYYEHGTHPWDWAAGSLVAEEAGARLLLPEPGTRGQLVVASAPGVHDELCTLLAAHTPASLR